MAASQVEADLERAQKEIEQLKTDHEVSLGKKEREVRQPDDIAMSGVLKNVFFFFSLL